MTPSVHPHPEFDWECRKCKFWHSQYRSEMAVLPNGQTVPLATAREQLPIGSYVRREMSNCFHDPKWVMTDAEQYCAQFQPKKTF